MLIFLLSLAVIQGLTEFLPISSSGHLAFFQNLSYFKVHTNKMKPELLFTFDVMLHFATFMSIIIFFYRDIWQLIQGSFAYLYYRLMPPKTMNQKTVSENNIESLRQKYLLPFQLAVWIVLANVPVAIVGLVFKKKIEALFTSPQYIAIFFIINGFILFSSRYFHKGNTQLYEINAKQAIFVGLMQMIAILPGISRSGSTITGGLWAGIKGKDAARFSFLLGLPAVAGASLLEARHLLDKPLPAGFAMELTLGMITAFFTGLLAIKILVWLVEKTVIYPFGVYTFCLGLAMLLFWKSV